MRLETNLPGFSVETIDQVEQQVGARFPDGLRDAWGHGNKFELGDWFFYPIKDERFFNKTWDDVIRANELKQEELPEGFVTLATNGSGDELGFLKDDRETIYVWWHELDELQVAALSFEAFVEVTQAESDVLETFCERVEENGLVFGLSAEQDEGWAYASSHVEDTDVLLFFSSRELALACRVKEWADYHVIELPVELFLERWLPNMSGDELLCGLDWSSELVGLEYDPETILEYFE